MAIETPPSLSLSLSLYIYIYMYAVSPRSTPPRFIANPAYCTIDESPIFQLTFNFPLPYRQDECEVLIKYIS